MAKKKKQPAKGKTHGKPAQACKPKSTDGQKFPVIGLGASAGGLEALKVFFAKVPEKSGMAYIVVVHMTPKQPSLMPELLQKITPVPVTPAKDGQAIVPDHIYVIPPNKEIRIFNGTLQLLDMLDIKHITLPIDTFFKSLALDSGARAGAVVMSGTGTDGTQGIKEIKANEGLVLVQSDKEAAYDGMPRSAISTGVVDMILNTEKMPAKLCQYFAHHRPSAEPKPAATDGQHQWLNKIYALLRSRLGHDFSTYKINTILRRVNRRMGLNQIESQELYVRFLREHPEEVEALFRELLIGVTSFFRDPDSFKTLKKSILPKIFDSIHEDGTLRAWVPGCSTGEEVYSLAMIIREGLEDKTKRIQLQLFGTDIDSRAIDKAREGLYPASIAADVSEDRLKRFFTRESDFYRIRKEIRDCAVFSVQDILKDPPFSRLNLLCCRNLLIYLDSQAQKKLLPLFHYTLVPKGILMLGSSETIGGFSNLYTTLDKKWKIYKRVEVPHAMRPQVNFPSGPASTAPMPGNPPFLPEAKKVGIGQMARQAILEQFAPTAFLIDGQGNLLHVQGRSGKYLETPEGPPTQNILDMARAGLRIELSSALRTARSTNREVIRKNISLHTNGDRQMIHLRVCPQHTPKELAGYLLVVFEDAAEVDAPPAGKTGVKASTLHSIDSRITELERELQNTRESHQTTIEELESSNEELKSTNEELQSSNEELQSTNEEMESSKEELQSLNEELQTVNAELQSKVEELSAAHDDMRNLLNSTEVATIFVDNQLRVKRFTKEATAIINLIPTDIGRPLQHVVTNLEYEGLMTDLAAVVENLTPHQLEVRTKDEQWYNMRIIPYRTTDNRIDGAVLTFAAIGDQKNDQQTIKDAHVEMESAWQLVRKVFDMNTIPIAVSDIDGRLIISNTAFSALMGIDPGQIIDEEHVIIDNPILTKIDLKKKMASILEGQTGFKTTDFEITVSGKRKGYHIQGEMIDGTKDQPYRILLQCVERR